jgi:hypothetical protein
MLWRAAATVFGGIKVKDSAVIHTILAGQSPHKRLEDGHLHEAAQNTVSPTRDNDHSLPDQIL